MRLLAVSVVRQRVVIVKNHPSPAGVDQGIAVVRWSNRDTIRRCLCSNRQAGQNGQPNDQKQNRLLGYAIWLRGIHSLLRDKSVGQPAGSEVFKPEQEHLSRAVVGQTGNHDRIARAIPARRRIETKFLAASTCQPGVKATSAPGRSSAPDRCRRCRPCHSGR